MAEALLVKFTESALKTLIGKLGDVLLEELQLFKGLESEIVNLQDELDGVQTFLKILVRLDENNDLAKTMMKQAREIAYDAEDCIDQFVHHMRDYHPRGGHDNADNEYENDQAANSSWMQFRNALCDVKRCTKNMPSHIKDCTKDLFDNLRNSHKKIIMRRRLAIRIQDLKRRAELLNKRRISYGMRVEENRNGATDNYTELARNLPAVPVDEGILSGINEPKKNLIECLSMGSEEFQVIAVVGFGGVGKTTLAKVVYESPAVKEEYKHRAFVIVSQKFFLNRLLVDIMKQLDKTFEADESFVTTNTVFSKLNGTKYLIVLDDVWSTQDWMQLLPAFPREQNCSRIIITTRDEAVAQSCCSKRQEGIIQGLYRMQSLSEDNAKNLFCTILGYGIERSDSSDSSTTESSSKPNLRGEIGEKILKKCGGMPLAIIHIAKLLASKTQYDEWHKFLTSMGSQLEYHPSLHGLKQIITLSFSHLPYHLKSCLLYLSIYPEDYEIKRKNLERRWVAEGFVIPRRGMTAEEVSETYFEELISRSIIQRARVGNSGKIKTCRIHDIMLEVIVSLSIEENFATIIDEQIGAPPAGTIRRLTAHYICMRKNALLAGSLSQVRSFTAFGNVGTYISCFTFELLRVLDLEGCRGLENARTDNICKLFMLKFLSLRATGVKHIPDKVGDLKKLETLDIRRTDVENLPTGVAKLTLLVHLLAGSKRTGSGNSYRYFISNVQMPSMFDKMESIQTLSLIRMPSKQEHLNSLMKLQKLRKLGVCIFSEEANNVVSNNEGLNDILLCGLQNLVKFLRSLTITGDTSRVDLSFLKKIFAQSPLPLKSLELRGELGDLPAWIAQLQNVTEITLCYSYLDWMKTMDVLKNLPNLLSLILQPLSIVLKVKAQGAEDFIKEFNVPVGFSTLKTFVIDEGDYYPRLTFAGGSMPKIEKIELSVEGSEGLNGLDNCIELKELVLQGPKSEKFSETVKNIKADIKNTVTLTIIEY